MDPFIGSAIMGAGSGVLGYFGQREANAALYRDWETDRKSVV